jgi:hypothetical protein
MVQGIRMPPSLCEKYCRGMVQGIRMPPNQPDGPFSISCEEFDRRVSKFELETIGIQDKNN